MPSDSPTACRADAPTTAARFGQSIPWRRAAPAATSQFFRMGRTRHHRASAVERSAPDAADGKPDAGIDDGVLPASEP